MTKTMSKAKYLLAFLAAAVLAVALSSVAWAAELVEGTANADKTITITTPENLKSTEQVTYTVYKIFDATTNGTAISYKAINGQGLPTGFVKDDANNVYLGTATDERTNASGEIQIKVNGATKYIVPSTEASLSATQIEAIKTYVGSLSPVGTVTITGPQAVKTVVVPDYGYYYVSTTTGTLVSINSTNKAAKIEDKNSIPTVDKIITDASSYDTDGKKALAQVGTDVCFKATITVAKGAEGYKFHDVMDTGLAFNGNNSVEVSATPEIAIKNWYSILETPAEGDDLTITFADGIDADTVITVTYTAKVTSDALQDNPAKNTATISYGENSQFTSNPSQTETYNAKFTVTKQDGASNPLANAGFVLKNSNNQYYKYTPATEAAAAEGTEGEEGYKPAVEASDAKVEWVNSIDEATEYMSGTDGQVTSFAGLANGSYTLVESTVPDGYNKAEDYVFTIAEHNYEATNLKQETTVVNNAGQTLPSTGGMGTTILYIVGGILVAVALVVLITKRRVNKGHNPDEL